MTQNKNSLSEAMKILEEFCCKIKREKEERRRRYEEWRRKNLGDCYAEKLEYSIGEVATATIGEDVLNVLKPGERVLFALDEDEDPCITKTINGKTYLEGYAPIYSIRCRCERGDFDDFVIIQSPLYIRGSLMPRRFEIPRSLPPDERLSWYIYVRSLIVTEYKGDGVFEIVDTDDYDYYFATFFTSLDYDVEEVEGAVWHATYEWYYSSVYDLRSGKKKVAYLSPCCDLSMLIILALIRRNEVARIRTTGKERYEVMIFAKFPPTIKVRQLA